ncbi:MAG: GNAT family N-acetyltransferase [Thermomicrobiales bacterium]
MVASTISRVEGDEEAIRTLTWLGGSFFSGGRLARFALDTWAEIGSPDAVNWDSAGPNTRPRVELWSIRTDDGAVLAAMTLHAFSWARLRQQQYFSLPVDPHVDGLHRLCVRRFDRLVAGATESIASYSAGIELGYIAVDPAFRGQGLGRTLFDVFQHRAATLAGGRGLAFTIVLARHAHEQYGSSLMSHLISRGATSPRSAVRIHSLLDAPQLPDDLFAIHPNARPTAHLAQRRGFRFAGYGRNLGQVWVRDQTPVAWPPSREEHPMQPIAAGSLETVDAPLVMMAR